MPRWSINFNHLAYADVTIILSFTNIYSLENIMSILQEYEKKSGQNVNKDKSFYYLYQNIAGNISTQVDQGARTVRTMCFL